MRDLARLLGMSHDHFARVFRRTYGMSPRTWLAKRRLLHAAVLLKEQNLPIAEVAERIGMRSPEAFARRFRAEMGCTPSQYRRQS